jgi:hypothetical protein
MTFVGDRYPLGPLEGRKASQEALGSLSREAIPSWPTPGEMGRRGKEADLGPSDPSCSDDICCTHPTFPHAVPLNIEID